MTINHNHSYTFTHMGIHTLLRTNTHTHMHTRLIVNLSPVIIRTSYPLDKSGQYRYTQDLLRLRNMSTTPSSASLPKLTSTSTPLHYEAWEERLRRHPDKEFSSFVLQGIQSGFRIGVPADTWLESARSNMPSCKALV